MEAIQEFLSNAELMPMLGDWVVSLVVAIIIYIVGKWVAKRITALFAG